jgi:hypothetical protein
MIAGLGEFFGVGVPLFPIALIVIGLRNRRINSAHSAHFQVLPLVSFNRKERFIAAASSFGNFSASELRGALWD